MIRALKTVFPWAAAAIICIAVLMINADAAVITDGTASASLKLGPGDHYDADGNLVTLSGELIDDTTGSTIVESSSDSGLITARPASAMGEEDIDVTGEIPSAYGVNYTSAAVGDKTVYTFEGKEYTAGTLYGAHKLSGYSADDTGSASTTSGETAKSLHTLAAASDLPLGTVVIIKGLETSAYDGMYVVEDRGGYYVETEKWLDIYFDTYEEAAETTDSGWKYAAAWIAEPVQ